MELGTNLYESVGVMHIIDMMRDNELRQRRNNVEIVKKIGEKGVEGNREMCRPKKKWMKVTMESTRACSLDDRIIKDTDGRTEEKYPDSLLNFREIKPRINKSIVVIMMVRL